MDKLELKHLAPYLPYGLKLQFLIRDEAVITGLMTRLLNYSHETHPERVAIDNYDSEHIWMFKPILRHMSDFDKIDNDFDLATDFGNSYYTGGCNEIVFINTSDRTYLSDMLTITSFLFENHFDVFGLIEKGLAIDINTSSRGKEETPTL